MQRADQDTPGRDNMRPGLHVLGATGAEYGVTWWDPHVLELDVEPAFGIRRQDLIEDPGNDVLEADRRRYQEWQRTRDAALEQGARPSLSLQTVTEWARRASEDEDTAHPVTVIDVPTSLARPAGPRFGTLVHAILATVPLDAKRDAIADVATLQARVLGASADEIAAAIELVDAALAHPLLARAREAWQRGRCRRETPITAVEPDGTLIEGVLDLAFEDDDGWTVIDFKTQAELAGPLARYRRQVTAYANVVSRVTHRPASAVLMRL